jgi:hypothetical protein
MAQFPDVQHAVSAVSEILSSPFGPHIRKLILYIFLFGSDVFMYFRMCRVTRRPQYVQLISVRHYLTRYQ